MDKSHKNSYNPHYIFVVGGVMSGIGKGIANASIGRILKDRGFSVAAVKVDPYVNIDAGTMNPIEHGEIFVTDDGTECDQDIGNYERFLEQDLSTDNYITTGRVYQAVIERERNLGYKGKCVEVVPHIPNEVIHRIKKAGEKNNADFILIEIGGTVGEYQNTLFLEAARRIKLEKSDRVLFIMVSYLPIPSKVGEMKTKPTQQAVKWLNMAGIQPDIILGRSAIALDELRKQKISISCNVLKENVISAPDVDIIYEIPINFKKDNLGDKILKRFNLSDKTKVSSGKWEKLVEVIKKEKKPIKIGLVGKYFETGKFILQDSYISVIEAIKHAAWSLKREPIFSWFSAEDFEKDPKKLNDLLKYAGVIVPGGFGERGIEGKINAIEFCRKNSIPFFGLCLGMQLAVVEFARNVCGIKDAHSIEFLPTCKYPVINIMPEQKKLLEEKKYGASMRLGAYDCILKRDTISWNAYKTEKISERHRHRYELDNKYRDILRKNGMVMAGINQERGLVEIVEIKKHPFFVGTQFHPEFKSRPLHPHPLFKSFIETALKNRGVITQKSH